MQKAIIIQNEKITKNVYKITFETNLQKAYAGQFVSILCPEKTLRRPFSIADFQDGKISCLYKVLGDGTKYISSLKSGDAIDYMAPLGNSFNIKNSAFALLVGAGIGIAPLLFLKKQLTGFKIKNFFIAGFKTENELIKGADEAVIGGSVLDNISELIEKYSPNVIYSCGPSVVLKKICEIGSKYNIETQVSMENIMACSIGVCRGCVIPLKSGKNAAVCKDGPVFQGKDILWD